MNFFTDEKCRLGIAHEEYKRYWIEHADRLPKVALQLSAGMLQEEMFSEVDDPVFLHDARIQSTSVVGHKIQFSLHGDDNGGLRIINLEYDCYEFGIPEVPESILANTPKCDLMCHEFVVNSCGFTHQILFANGTELSIRFRHLVAEFAAD